MADGFLGRWSRRKQVVREGKPVQDPAPPVPQAPVPQAPAPAGVNAPAPLAAQPAAAPVPPEPAAPPLPTLQDAQSLSMDSDFKPFASRAVAPEVRNAAMKKLFTDPHFNVMDGLDIYIDDYSKPSPLSAADMARMVGAQFLKLVEDPADKKAAAAKAQEAPAAAAPAEPVAAATQDDNPPDGGTTAANTGEPPAAELPPPHDDHADLQLQPDHAPERERSGPGAG